MKRLLLISNSTLYGSGYLDHAEKAIRDFLGSATRIVFVPFALYDRNGYTARARERFRAMGCTLVSLHDVSNPQREIEQADAIFVGGGNTFRLLAGLYRLNLLETIRRSVNHGLPYVGSSAGAIVACPTLKLPRTCRSCSHCRLKP
jgi:dipeptidase E